MRKDADVSQLQGVHLCGAEEIAAVFGVSIATVRQWRRDGAPVKLLGKKYPANYFELWDWIKANLIVDSQ